jgi:hypothetical protein
VDQASPRDSQPPRRYKVGVTSPADNSKPVAVETVLVLDSKVVRASLPEALAASSERQQGNSSYQQAADVRWLETASTMRRERALLCPPRAVGP